MELSKKKLLKREAEFHVLTRRKLFRLQTESFCRGTEFGHLHPSRVFQSKVQQPAKNVPSLKNVTTIQIPNNYQKIPDNVTIVPIVQIGVSTIITVEHAA